MTTKSAYVTETEVQVIPENEEQFHSFDLECGCEPFIYLTDNYKVVCEHHSWCDEDILDIAEYSLYHNVRQKIDC